MTVQTKQTIGILIWQALMLAVLIVAASWAMDDTSAAEPQAPAIAEQADCEPPEMVAQAKRGKKSVSLLGIGLGR